MVVRTRIDNEAIVCVNISEHLLAVASWKRSCLRPTSPYLQHDNLNLGPNVDFSGRNARDCDSGSEGAEGG